MEPEVRVFISSILALSILATIVMATPMLAGVLFPIKECHDLNQDTCTQRSECVWDTESNFCDYNQNLMYYESSYKEQGLIQSAVMILQAMLVLLVGKFMTKNTLIKNTLAITATLVFIYAIILGATILVSNIALTLGVALIVIFWFIALKTATPKIVAKEAPKKKSKK